MTLPERVNYSLTASALSPFPAEPAQRQTKADLNDVVRGDTKTEKRYLI
jgi:hypothetical protein